MLSIVLMGILAAGMPAQGAEYKVGFVNVPEVLEKAPQAEDARNRIEREFAPKDRELVAQQKEIRKLEDRLVRDQAVMAASEREKLEREIRALKREIRRLQDEFREDLNIRRNEELGKLQSKVVEAIQGLAKAEGYDLILTDGVVHASNRVDITDKVVKKLKAGFKGSSKK